MVAGSIEGRLQKLKMDRRHLGAQNGILLTHFFCERHFLNGSRTNLPCFFFLFPHPNGGEKGAYPDPGRAQVVYLVNFQTSIYFAGACQNIIYLVRSNCI